MVINDKPQIYYLMKINYLRTRRMSCGSQRNRRSIDGSKKERRIFG